MFQWTSRMQFLTNPPKIFARRPKFFRSMSENNRIFFYNYRFSQNDSLDTQNPVLTTSPRNVQQKAKKIHSKPVKDSFQQKNFHFSFCSLN